jgi:hypothetical protein
VVLVFRDELAVSETWSARIALVLGVVSILAFLTGLFRILMGPRERPIKGGLLPSEISAREYTQSYVHRSRMASVLYLALVLSLLVLAVGTLAVVLGWRGTVAVGGIIAGTVGGSLLLFLRSVLLPAYRTANENAVKAGQRHVQALRREGPRVTDPPAREGD